MSILREAGKNYLRSWVIYGIAALIGIPCMCLFIFMPLWFVNEQNLSAWYLVFPYGLFLLILFGGGFGAFAWVIYRRKQKLDALFVPLGFESSAYGMFFRKYLGRYNERAVRVYFSRGPRIEIEVATSLKTRLSIVSASTETSWLARLTNQQAIPFTDPALSDLAVYAIDANWAQTLLAQPGLADRLRHLVSVVGAFTRQYVVLRPGWLRLTLYGSSRILDFNFDITPQQAQEWLDALSQAAAQAESIPSPLVEEDETQLEQMAEKARGRNPYKVMAITVIATLVLICFTSAMVFGVVMLLEP